MPIVVEETDRFEVTTIRLSEDIAVDLGPQEEIVGIESIVVVFRDRIVFQNILRNIPLSR